MVLKVPCLNCISICLVVLILFAVVEKFFNYQKTLHDIIPKHLNKFLSIEKHGIINTNITIADLIVKFEKQNNQRQVIHWKKYGPLDSATPIIVIRVHRDLERLRYLVLSLAQVTGIETVLLIFSHSFYDENINYLVRQIDFCMVLQIFYPNSAQLYPNNFPGSAVHDCTNGTQDKGGYCKERDTRATEPKLHWWWTAHYVFNQLEWSKIHKDMVIFIDEDSYLLPDFLHMLRVSKLAMSYVTDVKILSFGRPLATGLDFNKLTVESWRPPYDNGLAFNKTTWRKIAALGTSYCQYDDTSWSYSLMHLFEQFPRARVVMMACMAPRVVSTGQFQSGKQALENIWWMTKSDQLFPKKVQAVMLFDHVGRLVKTPKAPPHGNGGWVSSRDYVLCFDPLMSTVSDDGSTTTPPIFTTEH